MIARCYQEAGLPPGVFNMIHGGAETGHRLVTHSEIDGILFTGSYQTGIKIKKSTIDHDWKILALEMGGKNSTIIWESANLEKAVYQTLLGVYLSSGQRCSCTSKIFVHKKIFKQFIDEFVKRARKLSVGHWSQNPFMGPLISEGARDRYLGLLKKALDENCDILLEGNVLEREPSGWYVSPSLYKTDVYDSQSVYQNTELFWSQCTNSGD